jgi:hypothetical protein
VLVSAALAACSPCRAAAAAPYCALYGTCRPAGGDAFTPRSVNCANAPGAVPPATPDFNLTACPEYQGAACCNEAQARRRRARYAGGEALGAARGLRPCTALR